MSRGPLFAVLAVLLATVGWEPAAARPAMAPAAVPGEKIVQAEFGYHNFGTCCPPGRYSPYRRHHGFSLRLGWGYPSYGYPWVDPVPVYAYPVRPLVVT